MSSEDIKEVIVGKDEQNRITTDDLEVDDPSTPLSTEYSFKNKLLFPLSMFYVWFIPFVWKGFRQILHFQDLPRLISEHRSHYYLPQFHKLWKKYKTSSQRLVLSVYGCGFGKHFLLAGLYQFLAILCSVAYPAFLEQLLYTLKPVLSSAEMLKLRMYRNVLPSDLQPTLSNKVSLGYRDNDYMIWIFLGSLILTQSFSNIFHQYSVYIASKVGMKIRTLLTSMVYMKSMRVSHESKFGYSNGRIINFVSSDLLKLEHYHQHFHEVWSCALLVLITFYFLFRLIEFGMVMSIIAALLITPVVLFIVVLFYFMRKAYLNKNDKRINIMNEVLQGIKIIKVFSWEIPYIKKIFKIRLVEVTLIRAGIIFAIILKSLIVATPTLMSVVGFITYYLINGKLDTVRIFTAMTYYNMVRTPLLTVPLIMTRVLEGYLSYTRISKFLQEDEVEEKKEFDDTDVPVKIINSAKFKHFKEQKETVKRGEEKETQLKEKEFMLNDINLNVEKGKLIMIVGNVGSGKSSLLSAMLGDMKIVNDGEVQISGSIAYCPQIPWIFNATLKDNVLFGKPLNEEKFWKCINICDLNRDLEFIEGAELVEIGEKGINLSGGQKYRVSLARACYFDSDIYLLDDPLASVDAHVGKHLFNECIIKYLKDKTRVLVTHQLQYTPEADLIVFVDDGEIKEMDTYENLINKEGGLFKELMDKHVSQEEEKIVDDEENLIIEKKIKKKQKMMKCGEKQYRIIMDEERVEGNVSGDVVKRYISLIPGSFKACIFVLIVFFITELILLFSDWYVTNFSSKEYFHQVFSQDYYASYYQVITNESVTHDDFFRYIPEDHNYTCPNNAICGTMLIDVYWNETWFNETNEIKKGIDNFTSLLIYGSITIFVVIGMVISSFILFNFLLTSSKRLFELVILRLIHVPMKFYDANPIGRIISRLSSDVQTLDMQLLLSIDTLVSFGMHIIGGFLLISYTTNGIFVFLILFIVLFYILILQFYRSTARELKRINSISRSPMFAQITETLNGGIPTIRAYKVQKQFIVQNLKLIDLFNRSHFLFFTANRWLEVNLSLLSTFIIFSAGASSILLAYYIIPSEVSFALLSLGITHSINVCGLLGYVVYVFTNSEMQMNSVERLDYYSRLDVEEKEQYDNAVKAVKSKKDIAECVEKTWIKEGNIDVIDYSMKYRDDLPVVLDKLSFSVKANQKVGVVGRTGCGKTTLMNSLFRIVNPLEGKIIIDGKNINEDVSLNALRNGLSIIPQDPVLFQGTIKSNLDPFSLHTDEKIVEALNKSHFTKTTDLLFEIDEGGKNLSCGERQILCLARALLKDARIIVLDECTASVDMDTDKLIQDTIRKEFKGTILTIAHRLSTIVDYDKILVMDKGKVVAFDTPLNLINDSESLFLKLINETRNSSHLIKSIKEGGAAKVETVEIEEK